MKHIDDLVNGVQITFQQLVLNNKLLTVKTCMENIMMSNGNNSYKIAHIN